MKPYVLLFAWLAAGCGVLQAPVARSVDGITTEGRFIEPEAYALYAVAATHEARGQWSEALATYERAFEIDDRGPELRTRIGALACRLRRGDVAERAFTDAERAAPDYGPLWYERAICYRSLGALGPAQAAALEAIRLDPQRPATSILAADIAEQRRDPALAWRLRDALGTHASDSPEVWRDLRDAAARSHDDVRLARAELRLRELGRHRGPSRVQGGIDGALEALAAGDVTTAKTEALLLLGADPSNGDALIVALVVADLEQDHATFDALLRASTGGTTAAHPAALEALGRLLSRRVGEQAASLLTPKSP